MTPVLTPLRSGSPPTASAILTRILRFAGLLLVCIGLLDAAAYYLGTDSPVINLLLTYLWPLARPFLWIGGLTVRPVQDTQLPAVASLLTLLLVWPFLQLRRYMQAVRQEARFTAPATHDRWFAGALALLLLAGLLRLNPAAFEDRMTSHLYLLVRLALILSGLAGTLVCLQLGFYFRTRHLTSGPERTALTGQTEPMAGPSRKKPALRVVSPPPPAASQALLVALVAELIQFCGQQNKAPDAAALAARLAPLLRAAQLTGGAPLGPGELETLCGQVLTLFSRRKISTLKDAKAAAALYTSPRPGAIDEIVADLGRLLGGTVH